MKKRLTFLHAFIFLFLFAENGLVYAGEFFSMFESCSSYKNMSNYPNPVMCSDHIAMMKSFVDNLNSRKIEEVVGQIDYPIHFRDTGKVIGSIETSDQLRKYYDFIFPKDVIKRINKKFLGDNEYFWNWRGMEFGSGAIWFEKESGKVIAINIMDDSLIKKMFNKINDDRGKNNIE